MVGHDGPTSFDSVSLRQLVRCRSESTGLLPASRSGAPTADGSCSVGRAAMDLLGIPVDDILVFSDSSDEGPESDLSLEL